MNEYNSLVTIFSRIVLNELVFVVRYERRLTTDTRTKATLLCVFPPWLYAGPHCVVLYLHKHNSSHFDWFGAGRWVSHTEKEFSAFSPFGDLSELPMERFNYVQVRFRLQLCTIWHPLHTSINFLRNFNITFIIIGLK